jgi:DNA-binding transcriptional ArsR family regulator
MNTTLAPQALDAPIDRAPLYVTLDQITTSVQLCLSPHCSTLASLIEGAPTSQWPRPANSGWHEIVADRADAVNFAPLAPYTCGLPLAPFLCAVLREPSPQFPDQVREIEQADRSIIRNWLHETFGDQVPAAYTPFRDDPDAALHAMSRALEQYFDAVIAPSWSAIRGFLDRELIRVGYLLATQPAVVVLSSLHPSMRIDRDTLVIDSPQGPLSGMLAGRLLKLTPLIASGDAIIVDFNGADEIKVGYAAPGVEELWADTHERSDDDAGEIVELLGDTRAAILQALHTPDSTTTLAHRLGISPASVSAHLTALAALGLVDRNRVSRRVYYSRTPRGDRLLSLFREPVALT